MGTHGTLYLCICVFVYLRICVFAYLLNLYLLKCEMCRIWRLVWQMRTHGTLKGFLQQFPEIFTCSTAGRSQSIATLLMQSNSKKYTDTNTNTLMQVQIHRYKYKCTDTSTNTQIQIHRYENKYINSVTQLPLHRLKQTNQKSRH